MLRIYTLLRKHIGTNPLDRLIIQNEVRETNILRSLVLMGLSMFVSAFDLMLLFQDDYTVSVAQAASIRNIITVNQVILLLSILNLFLLVGSYLNSNWKDFVGKYVPHVVFFMITLWGALTTIFDQNVTSSITSFILGCIICSLMLLINPWRITVYLSILMLVYYFGVVQNQVDPMLRLVNISEGFATIVVCFGLSITQWRTNTIRFKQSHIIRSQQETLKENYQELVNSSEQLEKVNNSKDKFFAILAHDLRGPISSTLALTEHLKDGLFDEDEKERKRMYGLLQNSLSTTGKLLENVLLWSRNHMGTLTFKPVNMALHEVIENNIALLHIVAAHKDITIINEVNKTLKTSADLDMVNTIIRNLLSNAIKFTPNFGKVEIASGEYYDELLQQQFITISVRDYGIGMTKKIMDNLFKIDKKITSTGTNNETGTGLGLILCHDFIQKHQGTLQVESEEGTGTTITFTIPHISNVEIPHTENYLCSTL
ncbi:signal transduction histidine kinase [Pedobacter sp. CAN_A7]|uniref:sensor histidine kinase n=1 Tax=Pedobacter sp. CAN_A7 TaxID=2787722 RepID=UPI0018C8D9EF